MKQWDDVPEEIKGMLADKYMKRDPENLDPYGPQNHPLPDFEPKNKVMTAEQLKEVVGNIENDEEG